MDPWDEWERRIYGRGRPERAARDLSDEELVNLLASCDRSQPSARVLKQEALSRLHKTPRADRGHVREPVGGWGRR